MQYLLRCRCREQMHRPGDDAGPTRLVTGAEARAVVAVEVFVELNEIAPVRIGLKLLGPPIDRPFPSLVAQEDIAKPASDFFSHLIKIHPPTGTGRTFDGEFITEVTVVV